MGLIQVRIDDETKKEAQEVFDKLGLDMSSAIKMFIKRTILMQDLPLIPLSNPFVNFVPKKFSAEEQKRFDEAWKEAGRISKENGNDKLTMEEIDEIIAEVRKEKSR